MTEQYDLGNIPPSPEVMAQQELDAFASNPGLEEAAALFGVQELPGDPAEKLLALQQVASEHWDFRKGAERQVVDWNDALLDQEGSEQWETVFAAADKLGLVQDIDPQNKRPHSLVILGGANKAPLDRLRYGLEHVEDFEQVVYLGSTRLISDNERKNASGYAPGATTEFDLGCGAFETFLGARKLDEVSEVRNGDVWGIRWYEFERNGGVRHGFVLSTPNVIGGRRATTYDNYRFFAGRAELAQHPDHSVVAVTTGFYTGGQHFPAVQELTLKYGATVETIGHSAEYSGVKRKPSQLLQEMKAAIDAAARLQEALGAA